MREFWMFGYGIAMGWFYINPSLGLAKERLVMGIHFNKNKCGEQNIHRQGTKGGLSLVFGLGNVLKWFYKASSLCWRNIVWWWGLCVTLNITQLVTNVVVLHMFCIGGHHKLSITKNPWSENFEFPLNFGHITFSPKQ